MLFGIPDPKDEVGSGAYDLKTESYREHSVRQKNSSRISTILQTYACVSTLPTDTAVFYAVMK